ncbi:unnamed protein product [Amoebophrya sp. A25]|nr:unnamed protein product [Amoebophrya sp. A25]|eukprot:GSA25T00022721001.1
MRVCFGLLSAHFLPCYGITRRQEQKVVIDWDGEVRNAQETPKDAEETTQVGSGVSKAVKVVELGTEKGELAEKTDTLPLQKLPAAHETELAETKSEEQEPEGPRFSSNSGSSDGNRLDSTAATNYGSQR